MSVRVVCRVRPLQKTETERDVIASATGDNGDGQPTTVRIPNPRNEGEYFSFRFNGVYMAETTQQELFDSEVAPTVKQLFHGRDVTLLAHGATGTGKTHTMRGVIPRLLSAIFRRARRVRRESAGAARVDVSLSYCEIYNDKVFDLFEPASRRSAAGLALREAAAGRSAVVGLTERPCASLKEFETLYDQANVHRATGATRLNVHSSRSHAVLRVRLAVRRGEATVVGTAAAIDLAGSEDSRRADSSKERLAEAASINRSLFVLGQCVEALAKKAPRVPFRESKMTRILGLGQNSSITVVFLNIASVRECHLDTLSSLQFANRAKKIEIREAENEPAAKGVAARPVAGLALDRRPLQTLTSANHNAHVRKSGAADELKQKPVKLKAFAVYADKRSPVARRSSGLRRVSSLKRASPLKRTSPSKRTSPLRQASPLKRTSPLRQTSPVKRASPLKWASPLKRTSPPKRAPLVLKQTSPCKGASPPRQPSPAKERSPLKRISGNLLPAARTPKELRAAAQHSPTGISDAMIQQLVGLKIDDLLTSKELKRTIRPDSLVLPSAATWLAVGGSLPSTPTRTTSASVA